MPTRSRTHCRRTAATRLLLFLALFALSACVELQLPGTREPAPPGGETSGGEVPRYIRVLEHEVAARVNTYRRGQGLPTLRHDEYVAQLAREHSVMMAAGRREFGHDEFQSRGDRLHAQLEARSVSENVAFNNYPAEAAAGRVVNGWIDSAGHRANMVGAFNRAGVGAARSADGTWYVTQLYAAVP